MQENERDPNESPDKAGPDPDRTETGRSDQTGDGAAADERTLADDAPPVSGGAPQRQRPASGAAGPTPEVPGFRVAREISRGGQAAVFDATQEATGRRVALKIIHGGPFMSQDARARVDREVQILAALEHPNIVQVIDRGETTDGSIYVAMQHIDGRPLDQWLAAYYQKHPEGPPPEDPTELLRLFLKVCDAVNAAHLRGVVHRDLKPSNILVDERDEPHVLDFGLAHMGVDSTGEGAMSMTGQFLGSLPWASPEQAEGNTARIDTRTDVYALGVILYQMLTRQFPYEVAGNMRDVLNNIVTADPEPPSRILSRDEAREARRRERRAMRVGGEDEPLNPTIEAIVLKALSKRRDDRYQNAGELSRDFGPGRGPSAPTAGRSGISPIAPTASAWSPRAPTAMSASGSPRRARSTWPSFAGPSPATPGRWTPSPSPRTGRSSPPPAGTAPSASGI